MAMIQCKECNSQVSTKAEKCPQCGAPTKQKTSIVRLLGLGLSGFLVLTCGLAGVGALVGKDKAKTSAVPETKFSTAAAVPEAKPSAPPAIQVEDVAIGDILAAYENNELSGDQSYKGKTIRFTGKLDETKKGMLGGAYVTVGTGKQFERPQIQCELNKSELQKAASFSKGETITMTGKVSGLMMNVLLDDCVFE